MGNFNFYLALAAGVTVGNIFTARMIQGMPWNHSIIFGLLAGGITLVLSMAFLD